MKEKVSEYEKYALQALEKDEQNLAHEVAEKIANLEVRLKDQVEIAAGYNESAAKLRRAVAQAEGNIKRLRQQADTVKATESDLIKNAINVSRTASLSCASLSSRRNRLQRVISISSA